MAAAGGLGGLLKAGCDVYRVTKNRILHPAFGPNGIGKFLPAVGTDRRSDVRSAVMSNSPDPPPIAILLRGL